MDDKWFLQSLVHNASSVACTPKGWINFWRHSTGMLTVANLASPGGVAKTETAAHEPAVPLTA